jgi:hypothetical protein
VVSPPLMKKTLLLMIVMSKHSSPSPDFGKDWFLYFGLSCFLAFLVFVAVKLSLECGIQFYLPFLWSSICYGCLKVLGCV